MSVTREEVKAMINALAVFVRSEDSTMEFRLISPAVCKPVKNFAGIINSMTHGMCNDIYSLFEPYADLIRMFSNALSDWAFGKQINFGEIMERIIVGEFQFPSLRKNMDKSKMTPEARLQYEKEIASFYALKGICEVWKEAEKCWVRLDGVRYECRSTITTVLICLKKVAVVQWCINNQAADRIDEEIKRVQYKSLVELAEEPCWEKKWSEQFGSWEKEIG